MRRFRKVSRKFTKRWRPSSHSFRRSVLLKRKSTRSKSSRKRSRSSGTASLRKLAFRMESAITPKNKVHLRGVGAHTVPTGSKMFYCPHFASLDDCLERYTYHYPKYVLVSTLSTTPYLFGGTNNRVCFTKEMFNLKLTNATSLDIAVKLHMVTAKRDIPGSGAYDTLAEIFSAGLTNAGAIVSALAANTQFLTSGVGGGGISTATNCQWYVDPQVTLKDSWDFNYLFKSKMIANIPRWAPGLQREFKFSNRKMRTFNPWEENTGLMNLIYINKGTKFVVVEFVGEIVDDIAAGNVLTTAGAKMDYILDKVVTHYQVPKFPSANIAGPGHLPDGDALGTGAAANYQQYADFNPALVVDAVAP